MSCCEPASCSGTRRGAGDGQELVAGTGGSELQPQQLRLAGSVTGKHEISGGALIGWLWLYSKLGTFRPCLPTGEPQDLFLIP